MESETIVINDRKTVSSIIPWDQVCRMLDKVQDAVREKKKEMLGKFIEQYRGLLIKCTNNTSDKLPPDSFFPVMRILLPSLDRDRGAYGVKEHKLAELYIKILGLKKGSVDAQKLLNYRKPKSGGNGVGDFADIAYYVLKNRCPEKGALSLCEVDSFLTIIAENYALKNHDVVERTVLQMLRNMTANEQKWLIRVLLKDMHLGIGQVSIFNSWHPDAKDFYDVTNSLFKVCSTLIDPALRLHEIEVSLFSPFRPMLAERAILEKVESQMAHKTFYAETKYDGERSQIHKNGNQYKYYSRNGFDFSSNFGTNSQNGLFSPHIHNLFYPTVKEAILDGEMVGWSQKYKTIITKGDHMDVKNLKEDGDWQVCFCVFDILYLNGSVLTNLPLQQRVKHIQTVLQACEGRVIITERSEVTNKEDVIKVLNIAIDNREEGIVLKDPDSVYQPASRKSGWIKVKPEYVDSLVPELDLLIIGGYYGTGRHRGVISHFLLAVAVSNSKKAGSHPKQFYSFCRIGSGYTIAELDNLIAKLSKYITKKQPPNVIVSREKPDVWINPEKSCVVQVKAAEIMKSELYKAGLTLRFPRVETIRADKSWYEILDTDELQKLAEEAKGKLASKHYISAEEKDCSPPKKKKAQHVHHPSLSELFRPADVSQVIKKADLFQNKEFCIMGGGQSITKHNLEKIIVEHGGTFSQHPGENTFCIICDKVSIRVKNYINTGLYNVIKADWILDCIKAKGILPFSPVQVFHLLPEDDKKTKEEFDNYGDCFYLCTDAEKLKNVMDLMPDDTFVNDLALNEMCEMDFLTVEPGDTRNIFRRVNAFVTMNGHDTDCSHQSLLLNLKLHGGTISQEKTDKVTHIIVTDGYEKCVRPSEFPSCHVVSSKWITESINEGKLLNERFKFW